MQHTANNAKPYEISAADWEAALQDSSRIVAIKTGDTTVWLKKSIAAEGSFGCWLLDKTSSYLQLPILAAVDQPGGREAIAIEAKRLQQLGDAGIVVPRLLWQNDEMILISDLGRRFTNYLKQHHENTSCKIAAIKVVFESLNQLHRKEQYLSQAFARNITIIENENGISVGFIDFEDDPLKTMSLENAQARDLLLLIYSLSKYIDNCEHEYQQLVSAQLTSLPEEVKTQLRRFISKFNWLGKLPGRRRLGNGYWRLTGITDVLKAGIDGPF